MIHKKNVSIAMNEDEYKILEELNKELNKRSFKVVNKTEAMRYACKFTKDNIDILELNKDLQIELKEVKQKNISLENVISEFQSQIKKVLK